MAKSNKVKSVKFVETIDQYLSRGGAISKLTPKEREPQTEVLRNNAGGPVTIMSLEEADLFYGEARKGAKPKKAKPTLKIDINALPPALKAKFISKLKEEADGEGYEEELEEIEFNDEDEED